LPTRTFAQLAEAADYQEMPPPKINRWNDLQTAYEAEMGRRLALGRLAESTKARYQQTLRAFAIFLATVGVENLSDINRSLVEKFKVWRLGKILEKKFARGGRGLALDIAILHAVFSFAVRDAELVAKNPVRLDGRPGHSHESGAQPFPGEQLAKLRDATNDDRLSYLLLRWTGFRGSDAVGLRWEEIDWNQKEINRLTQKRHKRVVLPIHEELFFALQVERDRRSPNPTDRVLLNPGTNRPLTRPWLYQRMQALGRRACVADVHPHRFRDTFAVDMPAKGANPYDVAKLLGDTVATVETHYA